MQIGLPVYSFIYTLKEKDYNGSVKFTENFTISQLSVYLLKQTNEERPDENEKGKSFPSGHTEAAFFAAYFLDYRYEIKSKYWFYFMASVLGISRVTNKKHWPHDVIAGALLGIYTNKLLTPPLKNKISVLPVYYRKNLYITLNRKF